MSLLVIPNTFQSGQTALSAAVNQNFTAVAGVVNGGLDSTNISSLNAAKVNAGSFASGLYTFPGSLTVTGTLTADLAGSGASLTNLNANNISSGTLAIARGGTGSGTQNFVDLTTTQSIAGAKTFTDTLSTAVITASGNVTAPGFFNASARALKTDIAPIGFDALAAINATAIVEYRYKDGTEKRLGFIADDAPVELSPSQTTFDVTRVLAASLRAVQQLSKRVEELERARE